MKLLLLKTIITTGGSLGRSRLARNMGGSRLVQTQVWGCSAAGFTTVVLESHEV